MTGWRIHLVIHPECAEYYCFESNGLTSGDSEEIKTDVLFTQTQHFNLEIEVWNSKLYNGLFNYNCGQSCEEDQNSIYPIIIQLSPIKLEGRAHKKETKALTKWKF